MRLLVFNFFLNYGLPVFLGTNNPVVKHNTEDWRGVVVAWEREDDISNEDTRPTTSLTSKVYKIDPKDLVKYSIILDSGDAHLHYSKRRDPGDMSTAEVHQSDLSLVEDKRYLLSQSCAA